LCNLWLNSSAPKATSGTTQNHGSLDKGGDG
jgi:hypothetical protein